MKDIYAGWFFDGSGKSAQKNVRLTVKNSRIESIRKYPAKDTENPNPFRTDIVDLTDCTILPTLVDSHVHLLMSGTMDQTARVRQQAARLQAADAIISDHIHQHLAGGILAVRDGGDKSGRVLKYNTNQFQMLDIPLQIKVAGCAWHRPGRYGKLIGRALESPNTLEKAIKNESGKIDHIKIVNSGLNSLTEFGKETLPQFDVTELKAAVSAADRRKLKTMVHANGQIPVQFAVAAGCHSIEHGFFMGADNLQAMADKAIFWVPTAVTMHAYCRYLTKIGQESDIARKNLDHQLEQLVKARKYGVQIAVGTDAGSPGVDHGIAIIDEMKLLMEAGFSIEETIKCATFNGVQLLGTNDMGLLTAKMPATFIAVKGDPTGLPDSLHELKRIYVSGELLISASNRNFSDF
ncbi:MAG: amidohydrolase family protein [Desulfobacterales bacterium]|nr:amidohydrolase family protein [Desulfobacterales bacterium]